MALLHVGAFVTFAQPDVYKEALLLQRMAWEACPRCHSSRVEIHGKAYSFVQGFGLLVIGAPLTTLLLWLFVGSFGVIIGAVVALLGVLMILTAPIMPRSGTCKDCKKRWTLAASPS